MKIAFIGTGVMGKPMALHLSDAGHEVSVYNRTYEKAKALEPKVKAFNTIRECIKDAEIIMTIVGYPTDVIEVYDTVIEYAKRGTILVDMTTSSPRLAIDLYHMAKQKGLPMLDAPVTGGDVGANKGTLSIMVGGDEAIFHKVLPLFKLMGTTVTYMGEAGSGMHAKLANQTAIAGNIIIRQRGTQHHPGNNVGIGKDHTLFALTDGLVEFRKKKNNRSYVSIVPFETAEA